MKARIRINGILIFLTVVVIAIFYRVFLRLADVTPAGRAFQIVGLGFILLGQLVRVSARGYKAEHSQQSHALVCGGPYAAVRNPMYAGIICIGLGVVSIFFRWWVACIFLILFGVRYWKLIKEEEQKLLQMFGEKYSAYQKRVPRLLPSVTTLCRKEVREYLPLKKEWLRREMPSIIPVLAGALSLKVILDAYRGGWVFCLQQAGIAVVTIAVFILIGHYACKEPNA